MYLLKLLQRQGMPQNKLRVVVYSLIVFRIRYALLAWGIFVSVKLCCKIDMFKRLTRYGYTTDYLNFSDQLDKADSDLFCRMRRSDHCLHHVLPTLRTVDNLRVRDHPYNLPECSTNVHKKSFVRAFSVWFLITFPGCWLLFNPYFGFNVFMCYIAFHCDVMSLPFLCAYVTLNKKLLTYLHTLLCLSPVYLYNS